MDRNYARPQVASVALDRDLNPAFLLIAVVFGMLVGLGFGLKDQVIRRGLGLDESYLVLASVLYGQDPTPTTASSIRQKLVSLNFTNPAAQVLGLGDSFSRSRDRQRQSDAEGLKALGDALNTAVDPAATDQRAIAQASVVASPVPTTLPRPTPESTPVAFVPPGATATAEVPSPTATVAATAVPQASPTAEPTAKPTVKPAAPATSASASGNAVARTPDNKGIVVRATASSKSARLGVIPSGSRVQVVQTVRGEAVEGTEANWYQVKYGNLTGYSYSKYIVADH